MKFVNLFFIIAFFPSMFYGMQNQQLIKWEKKINIFLDANYNFFLKSENKDDKIAILENILFYSDFLSYVKTVKVETIEDNNKLNKIFNLIHNDVQLTRDYFDNNKQKNEKLNNVKIINKFLKKHNKPFNPLLIISNKTNNTQNNMCIKKENNYLFINKLKEHYIEKELLPNIKSDLMPIITNVITQQKKSILLSLRKNGKFLNENGLDDILYAIVDKFFKVHFPNGGKKKIQLEQKEAIMDSFFLCEKKPYSLDLLARMLDNFSDEWHESIDDKKFNNKKIDDQKLVLFTQIVFLKNLFWEKYHNDKNIKIENIQFVKDICKSYYSFDNNDVYNNFKLLVSKGTQLFDIKQSQYEYTYISERI